MLSSKAYTEVYYIINQMSEELRNKIPKKIQENIKNRMDKDYEFFIDDDEYENIELLEDAEKILSVLYTDYLSTEEERKVIINKEKILESNKKKKLSNIRIHEFFEKKENSMSEVTRYELIEKLEIKWYKKIIEFFKKIFK